MRMIVITVEEMVEGEAEVLNRLFGEGMEVLHVRKPRATEGEVRRLAEGIGEEFRGRVVLHDHFGLVPEFGFRGVHLSGRNPVRPGFAVASVSRSCHSPEEVRAALADGCDYVLLSPVFDSISKPDYGPAFTPEQLAGARAAGVINERVVALGGVDSGTMAGAARYGFGGVAVLGALWGGWPGGGDVDALVRRFVELRNTAERL